MDGDEFPGRPVTDEEFWARVREDFSVSDYFRLNRISLKSPAAQASEDVKRECLAKWYVELEPDETLIAPLFLEDPSVYPAPQRDYPACHHCRGIQAIHLGS